MSIKYISGTQSNLEVSIFLRLKFMKLILMLFFAISCKWRIYKWCLKRGVHVLLCMKLCNMLLKSTWTPGFNPYSWWFFTNFQLETTRNYAASYISKVIVFFCFHFTFSQCEGNKITVQCEWVGSMPITIFSQVKIVIFFTFLKVIYLCFSQSYD